MPAGGFGGGGFFFGRQQGAAYRRNQLRDQLLAYGCGVPQSVSGSYRTLCVRACDGYYFPISYATNRNRFKTDAAVCQSLYPPGEAALYVHHTTGEDASAAVSLSGEPYAQQPFAFGYRSTYDHACATLFRSGSGALIGFTKPPAPENVVAASLVTPVSLPRRGKQRKVPDAAAVAELPANLDPSVRAAEAKVEVHMSTEGIRTVGPAYYYEPSYMASTGGEPPKLAKPDLPDPPVVSTDQPPVAASILPNPLDFFRKHKARLRLPNPIPNPDPAPPSMTRLFIALLAGVCLAGAVPAAAKSLTVKNLSIHKSTERYEISIEYPATGNAAIDREIAAFAKQEAADFVKLATTGREPDDATAYGLDVSFEVARNDERHFRRHLQRRNGHRRRPSQPRSRDVQFRGAERLAAFSARDLRRAKGVGEDQRVCGCRPDANRSKTAAAATPTG